MLYNLARDNIWTLGVYVFNNINKDLLGNKNMAITVEEMRGGILWKTSDNL